MTTTQTPRCCQTCLYMATHEKCDGCLYTEEDLAAYHAAWTPQSKHAHLPCRYLHYQEGNWMDRRIQAEIDGKCNIVIGGQGEAEVNTQWTPEETAKQLHYVAGECGYWCHSLIRRGAAQRLTIATNEGTFTLVWEEGQLVRIDNETNSKGWTWTNVKPFRKAV